VLRHVHTLVFDQNSCLFFFLFLSFALLFGGQMGAVCLKSETGAVCAAFTAGRFVFAPFPFSLPFQRSFSSQPGTAAAGFQGRAVLKVWRREAEHAAVEVEWTNNEPPTLHVPAPWCRVKPIFGAVVQVNIHSSSYTVLSIEKSWIHVQVVRPRSQERVWWPNAFYHGTRIRDNWMDELNWRLQARNQHGSSTGVLCPNCAAQRKLLLFQH